MRAVITALHRFNSLFRKRLIFGYKVLSIEDEHKTIELLSLDILLRNRKYTH